MIKAILKRLESKHSDKHYTLEGYCFRLPILGECFTFLTADGASVNGKRTTKVLRIDTLKNDITFKTRNSTYHLKLSL